MDTFTYFVPIDFTECCYNALQYTTTLARCSGGRVKLCHVVDLEEILESDNPVVVSFSIDRLIREAQKKMRSLREIILMEGIIVKEEIVLGNVRMELMKQIESVSPSVVVVGRDSSKQLTANSTLTYLTRNAGSPVLVVPQSYNSRSSRRAVLTMDLDFKKNKPFSPFSEILNRISSYFSVLEIRSLQFGDGKEALQWIEMMHSKGSGNPNLLPDDGNQRINEMIDFIRVNKIDLLCIRERRNIFSKFFSQNISKHLPRQVAGPVLVITV